MIHMKHGAFRKRSGLDIVSIGSGVIDHYARSKAFELKRDSHSPTGYDACLPLGAKLKMDEIVMQTGGGATNAAVTFSHLGLKTATICRVGDDVLGKIVTDQLKSEGISTDFVQVDKKVGTGQSIILLADIGYRSILVHRGASASISRLEIPWKKLEPRWFYVTSLAGDLGLMSLILDRAEAIGASVFWNPGGNELRKGLNKLKPLIQRVDIFDVNREEAAELTDQSPRHLKKIVKSIGPLPKVALMVSDGPKGAYLHTKCCTWYAPPLPGKRVNTTGAGDALGSGFLAGFIKTCDLAVGLKVGMLNALGVITTMGAKGGILESWPNEKVLNRVKVKPARLRD
jgi:sugar/nucleoside kinase (ribokinase family)